MHYFNETYKIEIFSAVQCMPVESQRTLGWGERGWTDYGIYRLYGTAKTAKGAREFFSAGAGCVASSNLLNPNNIFQLPTCDSSQQIWLCAERPTLGQIADGIMALYKFRIIIIIKENRGQGRGFSAEQGPTF